MNPQLSATCPRTIRYRRSYAWHRQYAQPIRNRGTVNPQLGHSFWLYVVWNPLNNPKSVPVMIQNPAKHPEHAAKPVVAARFNDTPAEAIEISGHKMIKLKTHIQRGNHT